MCYFSYAEDKDVLDYDLLRQGCARHLGLPAGSQAAFQVYLVFDSAGVGYDRFGSTFFVFRCVRGMRGASMA